MSNQHFLYISSDDSSDLFNNTPAEFTVKLSEPTLLKGDWQCALTAIDIPGNFTTPYRSLYICGDFVGESQLHNKKRPVPRRVPIQNGKRRVISHFDHLCYYPDTKSHLTTLTIYLVDESDNLLIFSGGSTYCQLHIVKKK